MQLAVTKEQVKFIERKIRIDFHSRYGDGEALRQHFFEQQNGLCALCNQPMQGHEGVFTQIEHTIAARLHTEFYAQGWSLEKVLDNANDLNNLRLTHTLCGTRKNDLDLEELPEDFFGSEQPVFLLVR
jgi:hypothetical protein